MKVLSQNDRLEKSGAGAYFDSACMHEAQGNRRKAIREYRKAMKSGFDEAAARMNIGRICRDLGDYDSALSEFLRVLELNPAHGEAHAEIGRLRERMGDYGAAVIELERALGMGFGGAGVLKDLGRVCSEMNEYGKAVEYMKRAIECHGGDYDTLTCFGRIYEKAGRLDEAIAEFERASGLCPEKGECNAAIGRIYEKKGEYSRALEETRRAADKGSDGCDVHLVMGRAYYGKGEYRHAVRELRIASERDPDRAEVNTFLGDIYRDLNEYDSAIREYGKASENGYESVEMHIRMGILHRDNNRHRKSIKEFRSALKASPDDGNFRTRNRILNDIEIAEKKTVLCSRPRSIYVTMTSKCNLKCVMCSVWKKRWDIPEKTAKELAELMPFLEKIIWTGGEVFLSPYFDPLFERASGYPQIQHCIVTNGLLIDRQRLETFNGKKVLLIMSVDAFTGPAYESIRVGGGFKDLMRNIDMINEYRLGKKFPSDIELKLQMVLMKENYRELDNIMEFAQKNGFGSLQVMPLCDSGQRGDLYANKSTADYISAKVRAICRESAEKRIHFSSLLPIDIGAGQSGVKGHTRSGEADCEGRCLWPWQQLHIDIDGAVAVHGLCEDMVIGNVEKQELAEIWNCSAIRTIRKRITKRAGCGYGSGRCGVSFISKGKYGMDG
ncbi:MAG: tetratricopeptide repeat protein [Elusimicrobia bacterium]|nr:tetratricopeptide repeat protein [Elusimicrobiota bacterium]